MINYGVPYLETIQGSIILDRRASGFGDREDVTILAKQSSQMHGFGGVLDL